MFKSFRIPGRASVLLGGQWGSEGKGAIAAAIAVKLANRGERFDIVTTNAGAQAGHTSVYNGKTRVVFHLPTASLVARDILGSSGTIYLNAGSIIDPKGLLREIDENDVDTKTFFVHPNAAVITPECVEAENRESSAQTRIASTRKGVGEALSRKVLRSGMVASDCRELKPFISRISLNDLMSRGASVMVEVPQGVGLSVDEKFYPYCTSRNCTVAQGLSDASIHPSFYGTTALVLRTHPIRVGNIYEGSRILGESGGCYMDQHEVSWQEIDQKAEITTVTKRVRRVFSFSHTQAALAMRLSRPNVVCLTFCDYVKGSPSVEQLRDSILDIAEGLDMPAPEIYYQYGPTTNDLFNAPRG